MNISLQINFIVIRFKLVQFKRSIIEILYYSFLLSKPIFCTLSKNTIKIDPNNLLDTDVISIEDFSSRNDKILLLYLYTYRLIAFTTLVVILKKLKNVCNERVCGLNISTFYHHHLSHTIDDCRLSFVTLVHGLSSMWLNLYY